jgi:hypothetical protein
MTRCPHDEPVKIIGRYTASENTDFIGAHKKAVRKWIKKGFPSVSVKRGAPDVNEWIIEQIEASRIDDHE